jgi:hypothetical protein
MVKQFIPIHQKPGIRLTSTERDEGVVDVSVGWILAYTRQKGFTRMTLTGGRIIDVRESIEDIEQMIQNTSPDALFGRRTLEPFAEYRL